MLQVPQVHQHYIFIPYPCCTSFAFKLSPMYTLPQNKLSIKNPHHLHTFQPRIVKHVSCAVTTTTRRPKTNRVVLEEAQLINKSPLLQNSGRSPIIDDPGLQSTWTHRAWVASGCTSVFVCLAKSAVNSTGANLLLEPVLAGLLGYLLADLGSGVYHWAIDNYGDASTAVFGSQIEAFQGHHKWPWTITRRQFANNLHALARVITFVVVPIEIAINDPVLLSFVAMCSGCIMFSQQFHAWAHGTKSKLPPVVVALQESGVLVSRSQHSAHHRQPYNNNYCIVSGAWNKILDENMVFEALELVFFFKFGVKPRSWAEPNSDWTEETEANLPQNL